MSSFVKTILFQPPQEFHSESSLFSMINYDSSEVACSSEILHLSPCFLSPLRWIHSSIPSPRSHWAPAANQAWGPVASSPMFLLSIGRMLLFRGFLHLFEVIIRTNLFTEYWSSIIRYSSVKCGSTLKQQCCEKIGNVTWTCKLFKKFSFSPQLLYICYLRLKTSQANVYKWGTAFTSISNWKQVYVTLLFSVCLN